MKKILSLLFLLSSLVAQTTGKISGVVVDKDKNDEYQLRSNNSFLHDNVD